ncbi:hypothetical protein BG011_009577 [Mortierella polycephala]|uniref:Major facilitator superfamily (MFS) profile domain-containing protein n=1 Tax=Mortierella polycephala TaxID=41804 RepID=A0A9P6PMU1_9FUNG|nr:hypothetical protein BG011_009577 [Mortierella polycephala]
MQVRGSEDVADERTGRRWSENISAENANEQVYPEGGCLGIAFCWGVFHEYFLRTNTFPGANAQDLAWVGSLSCASIFAAAPAIVIMVHRLGTRFVLVLGVLNVTAGFLSASFATQYWHLYLTIGLLYGCGGCLVYFTSTTVLAQYFNKRRAVVVGIAVSGSGIGASVMAPLLRWMLAEIGFRWTMRIMSGCMFVCLGLTATLVQPLDHSQHQHRDHDHQRWQQQMDTRTSSMDLSVVTDLTPVRTASVRSRDRDGHGTGIGDNNHDSMQSIRAMNMSRTGTETAQSDRSMEPDTNNPPAPSQHAPTPSSSSTSPILDFTLFKNPCYTLIFIGAGLFSLVYLSPLLLIPSFATSIGLSATQGATMITISSAVGIVARILIGYLADLYGVLNLTILCCLFSALACLIFWLHVAHSFVTLGLFMVFYGIFAGSGIMLFPVAATNAVPESRMSSALGYVFSAHTIGYLFGTPLAQSMIASPKSGESGGTEYIGAIIFIGITNCVCAGVALAARLAANRKILVAI